MNPGQTNQTNQPNQSNQSNQNMMRAFASNPLEMMYRWQQYQEQQKENFANTNPTGAIANNNGGRNENADPELLFGLAGGMFFLVLLLMLVPFILAIYLLVKHGDELPQWVKIIGWVITLLPVIPFGSVITIILVLSMKNKK
jgi:hypothetical protein